ncbi:MAG: TRAP transporter small permease [Betaproteobacteria bacterium]|nr:TRAP transporter small permease [Betaproteobacteria bacterium]
MRAAALIFGGLAAVALAAMMLLTVTDVVLRMFWRAPIQGTLELVELGLACAIFLALPAVFLRDEHLVVDVVDHFAKRPLVRLLDLASAVVSAALLALMAWQMVSLAQTTWEFGDVTSDLSIPRIYYWVPVLFGVVASAAAALVLVLRLAKGR